MASRPLRSFASDADRNLLWALRMNRLPLLVLTIVCLGLWLLFVQRHASLQVGISSSSAILNLKTSFSAVCEVATWNRKTRDEVPNFEMLRKAVEMNIGKLNNILDAQPRLVSAFVYPDHITIITTAMHTYGKPVTCRYFDCNRTPIPGSDFRSIVVPMASVSCPRRFGAEYVALGFNETERFDAQEPIPLTYRAYENPIHELSVCVGPLYGRESKWLEVIEYVEHYRLLGATYFYFSLFNVSRYDRRIIDDYERLGVAEATSYVTEYESLGWQFHMIQTQECHHRSKFHSKWVLNVDIDERLVFNPHSTGSLMNYLRSMPSNMGELSFSTNRVLKTERAPAKFTNETDLMAEMSFLKYNQTTETSWYNFKGAIRPELVGLLAYHWSYRQREGVRVMSVPKRVGYIRHYRSTDKEALNGNWRDFYNGTLHTTRLESSFEEKLVRAVRERVRYVYEQRMIRCEEISKFILDRYSRHLLECKYRSE